MIPQVAFGSKLGLQTNDDPHRILPILQNLKEHGVTAPLVKSIMNGGVMLDSQHISPNSLRVLRLNVKDFDNDYQGIAGLADSSMVALARQHIDKVYSQWPASELAAAQFVELVNEVDPPQADGWKRLFTFLSYLCLEATRRNLHIFTPGAAYGTPEYSEWESVVTGTQFFQNAMAGGHGLSLHEGVDPGSDTPLIYGSVPGAPPIAKPYGATMLRYRPLYEALLKPRHLVVPLLISELVVGGGFSASNWQMIWNNMAAYDHEIRQDYYVVGATPFILSKPADPAWPDYSPVWDDPRTTDYYAAQKDVANAVPDSTETPPPVGYTHLVYNCAALNVRRYPWAGRAEPVIARRIVAGQPVTAYGVYRDHDMRYGWACISDDGDEWVSSYYLRPV